MARPLPPARDWIPPLIFGVVLGGLMVLFLIGGTAESNEFDLCPHLTANEQFDRWGAGAVDRCGRLSDGSWRGFEYTRENLPYHRFPLDAPRGGTPTPEATPLPGGRS